MLTLYSWLLALYPRRFRERFGDGMRDAFAEDYRRACARGRLPALRFLATTLLLALWFGLLERLPTASAVRGFATTDVRDAVRSLAATPLVTAVAVVSLALGIGANSALFSILNSLVIRPLPVHEPERLVLVGRKDWTNPIWEQIRDRQHIFFASAGAWSTQQFDLAAHGQADPVTGAYVSGTLFETLGVRTTVGRPVAPADDVRGGGADGFVAVISHRLWQRRFPAAESALGQRLNVSGIPFTVVGVAPPGFHGPEIGRHMDVFVPLAAEAAIRGPQSNLDDRAAYFLNVVGRLKQEQELDAAATALNAFRPALREATMPQAWSAEYRAGYLTDPFELLPAATGVSSLRDRFEQPLTIVMFVVVAVLLIACANIANLMLARANARRHELSIRLALGASRLRVAGLLMMESVMLAGAGGLAGLLLAESVAALLVRELGSDGNPVALDLAIDWRVLAFTASASLGATLLFGVLPALGLRTVEPNDALKERSRGIRGERRLGLRSMLVVAQVALSFVLVVAAGLFVRTFATLATMPLGFDPAHLLIVNVHARSSQSPVQDHAALAQRLADAASRVPGITRASLSFLTPLGGRNWTNRVVVSGGPVLSRAQQVTTVDAVAPGWFETYGMRVIAGRDLSASDRRGGESVAVVNETFVRRLVGTGNPLGQRIRAVGLGPLPEATIVGVVNDSIYRNPRTGIVPTMYLSLAQTDSTSAAFSLTVRTASDPRFIERSLAEALSREQPASSFSLRTYTDQIRATVAQERLVALLSGFFGVLALLLAAIGLYGVTAYSVGRRRPELALRMALGASRAGVVLLVLGRVALLIGTGTAVGLAVSVWAAKFVASLLFSVDARDPITIASAAAVLAVVGLFAGWLPARSAAQVEPGAALRS